MAGLKEMFLEVGNQKSIFFVTCMWCGTCFFAKSLSFTVTFKKFLLFFLNSSLWFLLLFSFSSQLGWSKSFRNTSAALDLKGFSRSVEAMKLLECWNQSWKPWAKQQIRRFSEFCHTVSSFLRYNYIHTTLIVDDDYRPKLADGEPNSKGLYTNFTDYHHWRWYNPSQEKRL